MKTNFETKEQYLNFRAAWKRAVNSPNAKSKLLGSGDYKYRQTGWITGAHTVLFNILRNKPYHTGFVPLTNLSKIQGGCYINRGLYEACSGYYTGLDKYIRIAKELKDLSPGQREKQSWKFDNITKFLEPFGGTVTIDMMAELTKLDIQPLQHDYGPGRKVFAKIVESTTKPEHITFDDINEAA